MKSEIKRKKGDPDLPEGVRANRDSSTDYIMVAAGIAHDLNNVLSTISGYAEMMQDDLPPGSPAEIDAGKILTGVSKAKLLTGELLALGKYNAHPEKASDVPWILQETIDFVKAGLPDNIIIKTDTQSAVPMVQAQPVILFRIFLNIIKNAIRSMEEKGGTLTLKIHFLTAENVKNMFYNIFEPNGCVIVAFGDTGTGMEPEVINRIFDPYYTDKPDGTGLGLMVVRRLIADIRGEITVESKVNEGSEFTVYLPAVAD